MKNRGVRVIEGRSKDTNQSNFLNEGLKYLFSPTGGSNC